MELVFATSDLEAAAQSGSRLQKIFGASARRACQRLYELAALETLAVAAGLPTLDLRPNPGSGRFSVSVSRGHRITFEPIHNTKADKGVQRLDPASVTAIRILALGGRHDD
jgi:hypothetical protein